MSSNIPVADKPYDLTFEEKEGYLYAHIQGDIDTVEISAQYWKEVAEKCAAESTKRVMIHEDLPSGATMGDVYQIASELPNLGFFGIKIAFVDTHIDQQTLNEFGELVAVNRGIFGKIFNDVSEAEKWLREI